MSVYPRYLAAYSSGKLKKIANDLFDSLHACVICPRLCSVDRWVGKLGFCKTKELAKVYSFLAHHGEEPPISGSRGSGTIFFSHCNLGCVYCQNYEFSQLGKGKEYTTDQLAQVMIDLQNLGCHNINLVTPTHVLPQILLSLELAIAKGLRIPLVYNTSGYERAEIIALLDGIVDIYLADMRYADALIAKRLSEAANYPQVNQEAIKQMYRQVGKAEFDSAGLIKQGLIIRHLVLPNQCAGTDKIMRFIAQEISPDTYVSLMSQYLPYHQARDYIEISRRLEAQEYQEAKNILAKYNLANGWIQESYGAERFAGVNIKPKLKTSKVSWWKKIINFIFIKLFLINDTPEKIALGVSLGVFCGLLPGTGPAAALFLAFIFRANRAAAFLGGIVTNTWLSLVTFILAIKLGSVILMMRWQDVYQKAHKIISDFHWSGFFKLSFLDVLLPLVVGYLVIGLFLAVTSYIITLHIIRRKIYGNKTTHK